MPNILFEPISPERVLFSREVRTVMLPAREGDMTVLPGHEPIMTTLDPDVIVVTDASGHGEQAFVGHGFVSITCGSVAVLAERALPPERLTRNRFDEEILRLETIRDALRDDAARRETDFVLNRVIQDEGDPAGLKPRRERQRPSAARTDAAAGTLTGSSVDRGLQHCPRR